MVSSASSHEIRSKRASPLAPTRLSGVRSRRSPWTNSGYALGTLAPMTPSVYGLAREPRMPTMRFSSTVTVRLQVSGQSRGQTLACSTFIGVHSAKARAGPSSDPLAGSSGQNSLQPRADVANLAGTHRVRNRVLVPLEVIAERGQQVVGVPGARHRDERVLAPVRHEDRRLAVRRADLGRHLVGEWQEARERHDPGQ